MPPHAEVWHLFIGFTYSWKITAHQGGEKVAESETSRFTRIACRRDGSKCRAPPPFVVLVAGRFPRASVYAKGLIYRSAELNDNLSITARGRRIMEDDLKIRTDFDLRGEHDGGGPVLDSKKAQWINVPFRFTTASAMQRFVMDIEKFSTRLRIQRTIPCHFIALEARTAAGHRGIPA